MTGFKLRINSSGKVDQKWNFYVTRLLEGNKALGTGLRRSSGKTIEGKVIKTDPGMGNDASRQSNVHFLSGKVYAWSRGCVHSQGLSSDPGMDGGYGTAESRSP